MFNISHHLKNQMELNNHPVGGVGVQGGGEGAGGVLPDPSSADYVSAAMCSSPPAREAPHQQPPSM